MSTPTATVTPNLQERLRFETMLSDLSSRFVNLEPAEVDRAIEDAQRRVCDCLGLDIAALWQLTPEEPGVFRMTHLYRRLGGPPVPDDFDGRSYNPWALGQLLEGQVVALPDIDDSPDEADVDRQTWRHFGIKSVYLFPLLAGGGPIFGGMSFHAVREEARWADDTVQRLQLVCQIFANALVRKRSDAALREGRERLQLAADEGGVGMWMLDVGGNLFWATDRARQIFGYSTDTEVTMELFLDSVHPWCRQSVAEAVRNAMEGGREIDIEYRIVRADGGERWVHSRGRMREASATSPARLHGATIDVTEQKVAFEEVERLRQQLEIENAYLNERYTLQHGSGRIVGESTAITRVLELVEQVAPTGTTVLIEGETGTGKELVAQRIHELSLQSCRPLVKVNCAALPGTLVESELFGREKGAYTGAISREPGRFEVADGSTLFLDEIAELPFELQSKLLRVLEEGQFERVGSSRTLTTDVRVIAATNRDLEAEVEAGRFRRDLFFRLAVFPIRVPPLRERSGDVPLLVWAMVQELGAGMNKSVETIRPENMERLQSYGWPGNVRELRNIVERAMILSSGPVLPIEPPEGTRSGHGDSEGVLPLDEVQRRHILKALEAAGGRIRGVGGAAEMLGLKPTTLRSRMERLGLDPRRLRDDRSST